PPRPAPLLHSFPTRRSSDLLSVQLRKRRRACRWTCLGCPVLTGREPDRPSLSEPVLPAHEARDCLHQQCDRRGDPASPSSVGTPDRKSTRLNSSHRTISYAV